MQRIPHGSTSPPSDTHDVFKDLGNLKDKYFFDTTEKQERNPRFFHMFEGLADNKECLIPDKEGILKSLSDLGAAMCDKDFDASFDSDLASAYTYFAQFVNHDINFTDVQKGKDETDFEMLASPDLRPWTKQMISERVSNTRDGMLELDVLYGRLEANVLSPREKGNRKRMALGTVTLPADQPSAVGDDIEHDVVRGPKAPNLRNDRTALIGDRRNDSNLIVSQLHVAFLRAHNKIVDRPECSFEQARQILRKHYHSIILHDFLPKIVPQHIIDLVMNPEAKKLYHREQGLPLEFSVAAFRFGHSMIRRTYYYNAKRPRVDLSSLFTLVALSNSVAKPVPNQGFPSLPKDRIIQWQNFIGNKAPELHRNKARRLRTQMVDPLFHLFNDDPNFDGERSLAVQDLKRGYMFCIPTGQRIADELEVPRLTPKQIEEASTPAQVQVLKDSGMLECTPLSFYVLAEATLNNGMLGEVGGRIVAEVLIGLIRDHPDSIIGTGWKADPALGAKDGKFSLSDLLRLAGVLAAQ